MKTSKDGQISVQAPPVIVEITKEYKDSKDKFDEIISAVGDYFDLFKQNTKRLEDLWL